jgi:hypothetical protein
MPHERQTLRECIDKLAQAKAVDAANAAALARARQVQLDASEAADKQKELLEEASFADARSIAEGREPGAVAAARQVAQAAEDRYTASKAAVQMLEKQDVMAHDAERKVTAAVKAVVRLYVPELWRDFLECQRRFFAAREALRALPLDTLTSEQANAVEVARGAHWADSLPAPENAAKIKAWVTRLRSDADAQLDES